MRTFAPERQPPYKPTFSALTRSDHASSAEADAGPTSSRPGHHFGQIPVYAQAGGPGPQQQAPVQPAAAAPRKWQEVWKDFRFAGTSAQARIPALTLELIDVVEAPGHDLDILNEGMQFVKWLVDHGDAAKADRVLDAVHKKFLTASSAREPLPSGGQLIVGGTVLGDPGILIGLGQDAARAGKHAEAFKLMGVAHEILTLYALRATESSKTIIANNDADLGRSSRYRQLQGIYDEMRAIYSFYFVLEREALAKGDAKAASDARAKADELRADLIANHSPNGDKSTLVAETSRVMKPGGKLAFTFHGANYATTDLTELPGHSFSDELRKSKEAQEPDTLENVRNALAAQADLQAEIARQPEIRKEFGNDPVELTDAAKRLKTWRIMYGVYKKAGTGALGALMGLIGRYLKAYTAHTGFNVRDFGQNYLDSALPTDLTGRLVMDCGVYALTVAWDVMQTVKSGDSGLKVTFRLATMLDHVMLIVTDQATKDFYLVNNNQIIPVKQPPAGATPPAVNVDEEVMRQYSILRNLPFLVSPINYLELGSTATAEGAFHNAAWSRFLAATAYMAKADYGFPVQKAFSEDLAILDSLLAPLTSDSPAIEKWLNARWPFAFALMGMFARMLNVFKRMGPAGTPAASRNATSFQFRQGGIHPLARVALVLVRFEALGGVLSPEQRQYLLACQKELFVKEMAAREAAAKAGQF